MKSVKELKRTMDLKFEYGDMSALDLCVYWVPDQETQDEALVELEKLRFPKATTLIETVHPTPGYDRYWWHITFKALWRWIVLQIRGEK